MDVIHTADVESPIGSLRFASTATGLAYLQLPHQNGRGFDGWRVRHAPDAVVKPGFEPNQLAIAQVLEFLEGKLHEFDVALDLRVTEFQGAVYDVVSSIPYGEVSTYGEVAATVGRPRAVRAVGTAVGRNPISWLIPCHRALRKSGGLGGYHWGLPVKRAMLAWESARADTSA